MTALTENTPEAGQREEPPSLAYERTRIASERTLMAWVRTAVSLIGFGFSIPKLFGYLAQAEATKAGPSPFLLGIVLIGLGTVGLVGGIVQHIQLMRRISPRSRRHDKISVALLTAVCVGLIGILAFLNVLLS